MADLNPALQGLEHPAHEGDCTLIKLLPVRYALTSEHEPPLPQNNSLVKECCPPDPKRAIPDDAKQLYPLYQYTLRTLRVGFSGTHFQDYRRESHGTE